MFAPGAVWTTSGFEGAVEGRQALRGLFEDFRGPFEDYALVPEELRDLGSGVIFAVILQRGRPKGSSEFVELRLAAVAILREGLIERFATDTDIDEARAAVGRLAWERG
jgi:hypothetical protein